MEIVQNLIHGTRDVVPELLFLKTDLNFNGHSVFSSIQAFLAFLFVLAGLGS